MRERTEKTESSFFSALKNVYSQTRFLPDEREPLSSVLRFANRASRNDATAFGSELLRKRGHSVESCKCGRHRVWAQSTRLMNACAQPRSGLHFIHDANRTGRRYVGYRLANRVRSNVDCGNS